MQVNSINTINSIQQNRSKKQNPSFGTNRSLAIAAEIMTDEFKFYETIGSKEFLKNPKQNFVGLMNQIKKTVEHQTKGKKRENIKALTHNEHTFFKKSQKVENKNLYFSEMSVKDKDGVVTLSYADRRTGENVSITANKNNESLTLNKNIIE